MPSTGVPPAHSEKGSRMSQLLRVQNFMRVDGRIRRRRRPEPRGALRTCRAPRRARRQPPGRPGLVGVRHRELAEPDRARRIPRARRLLHARLRAEHRCRDHGPQQVRAAAWPVGEPRLDRVGGETPRPSTPPCSSSPTITDRASRWPTPRSTSSMRRPRRRCGKPRTPRGQGRTDRGRRRHRSAVPRGGSHRHHPCRRRADRDRPGERLWTSPEDLLDRFHLESVPSPSGVTHLLFWRR